MMSKNVGVSTTTTKTSSTDDETGKHPIDLRLAFSKVNAAAVNVVHASLRNVQEGLKTSVKAITSLESSSDLIVNSENAALEKLKNMVESEKGTVEEKPQKWNFATVPLDSFQKTLDDVFLAFIRWSRIDHTNEFNVSRAYARLAAYATWMDNTGRDMIDPPLDAATVKDCWNQWNMKVSYDKDGHFVWWLDIADLDLEKLKSIPAEENLRLFVWFSHFIMFDPQAQQNGCVLVQNLGKIRLWNCLNMLNPDLAHKIDRLTIGTMPVKMKQIYICESPQWAKILVHLMTPFMSPIVRGRIVFLGNPKVLEDILGLDCIPSGFFGTQGRLEKDIVWAVFLMT